MPKKHVQPASTLLKTEISAYLREHPEIVKALEEMEKAAATFGEFARIAQPRLVLREAGGASTECLDSNAPVSRPNH